MKVMVELNMVIYEELLRMAQKSDTPAEILLELAKNRNWRIRRVVAGNVKTPAKVLAKLARDYWQIAEVVAKNPNTPAEVISELKRHENIHVRRAAEEASNR